jgi:hypothetical protein
MNITLIKKLTQIGVIRQNTEIEATYLGVDLSGNPLTPSRGTFFIQNIALTKDGGAAIFTTVSTVDGSGRKIRSENVHTVDGMPIERLAGIYGIDEGGSAIAQGKRRGRRPRAKQAVAA